MRGVKRSKAGGGQQPCVGGEGREGAKMEGNGEGRGGEAHRGTLNIENRDMSLRVGLDGPKSSSLMLPLTKCAIHFPAAADRPRFTRRPLDNRPASHTRAAARAADVGPRGGRSELYLHSSRARQARLLQRREFL